MRYLLTVIIICCLLYQAVSRPADNQENDSELEDVDYETSDAAAAEDAPRDEEAPLNDRSSKGGDQDEVMQQRRFNRNEYMSQNGQSPTEEREARRSSHDNLPEYKMDTKKIERRDDETDMNNEDRSNYERRKSDRYLGNNPDDQLVPNPDSQSSGFEGAEIQNDASRNTANNKRTSDTEPDDSSDLLFDNIDCRREQLNKLKKNNRDSELAEQNFLNKKYHNSLKSGNKEIEHYQNYENRQDDSSRDRREVPGSRADDAGNLDNKGNEKTLENEDEQAAIKRHIKKLSNNELEDLLNSLSEDKRALLHKIIESDSASSLNNLKKREITKKAGAVEENNYLDGGQDSNKSPGPVINMNTDLPTSQNTDTTEGSKTTASPSDSGDIPGSTKNVENNSYCPNKMSTSANEDNASDKLGNINSIAPTAESVTSKTESKREVDVNTFNNDGFNANESLDPPNDQSYGFAPDEDLSQLMDDEAQLHYENRNNQKRDTSQEDNSDFSDSMKSLQESFPNSNAYSYDDIGPYSGSDMAPLIRVKRRNKKHAVKKRDAAIFPESKVAYVPYRAENEDEDNDEGNEFYDDGFFDRTASFAKNNVNKLSQSQRKVLDPNTKRNTNRANLANLINNGNSDTLSIGSDTDSVLSGVEGVDENLMYNGGARKKRAVEKGYKLEPADDLINRDLLTYSPRSTTPVDDIQKKSDSFTDIVNYTSNEAFGPLPRSYDGELTRFKRIRRLKQQPIDTKELSSTNTPAE